MAFRFAYNYSHLDCWLLHRYAVRWQLPHALACSEQLGVNFKASKAARLLHARRLCDLRTTRFSTIFTTLRFHVFDSLGA
jgi:hypothetical protein